MIKSPTWGHLEGVGKNGRTSGNTAGRDISNDEWKAYDAAARAQMRRRIDAVRSGPLHEYGMAASLMGLLQSSRLGKKGKKTLQEFDSEAYQMIAMRRALVEERTKALLDTEPVRNAHRDSENDAIRAVLGNRRQRAQGYRDHLLSEGFLEKIRYKSFAERQQTLASCLFKLNALDPGLANEAAMGWLAAEIDHDPVRFLVGLPADQIEKSARDLLELLAAPSPAERARQGLQASPIQSAPAPPVLAIHNILADPKQREAIARALSQKLRAPRLRNSLSNASADTIFRELRTYRTDGSAFFDELTKTARGGRIANVFFSCWALVALARSGPFDGADNKLMWKQIGVGSQTALGLISSAPDFAKFCTHEIRPLLSCALVAEIKTIPGGTAACKATHVVAIGPRIAAVCGVAGVVGSVVTLYYTAKGLGQDMKDKDSVGATCKVAQCVAQVGLLTAGLAIAFSVSCAPLLVGALALSAAASLADKFFGESHVTSEVKLKLKALKLFEVGNDTRAEFKRDVKRTRGGASRTEIRGCATTTLPLNKRLELIISCMKGKTKSDQEAIVWKMFRDTRSDAQAFIWLIEATDPARVADELENDQEALDVLSWTLGAYGQLRRVPGRGFTEQLVEHCKQHRWKVVLELFDEVNDSPDKMRAYDKIPPDALRRACEALMQGHTNSAEECSVSSLLNFATKQQLEAMFKDYSFERRVKDELSDKQWRRVNRRLAS